jgi:hypothetical protein
MALNVAQKKNGCSKIHVSFALAKLATASEKEKEKKGNNPRGKGRRSYGSVTTASLCANNYYLATYVESGFLGL